jgi:predicted Zn-dependent protease
MKLINRYLINTYIILAFFASGCSVNPHTLEREFNIVSEEKEINIGRSAHPQIIEQFGYYQNPELQQYVNEVGQKIVSACPRHDIIYHFTVLDDPMENAFATPGGYIYVTRGLLAILNSEAELAGVLAHEVGHVVGKDSATLMSQSLIAQFATLAGVAGSAGSSSSSDLAIATSQLTNSIMLGFSRKKESLADDQAVEYTYEAGYDPSQIISLMRTLSYKSQGPTGMQQYLVTHPYIFDRISQVEAKCKVIRAMRNTIGQIQNKHEIEEEKSLVLSDKYKSYLDGLAYGPKENLRHIKIHTVRSGDTFSHIANKTLGSSLKAKILAYINGMPENAQLIPGAKIKTIY